MVAYVKIRNVQSGKVKDMRVGWSWTLFFFLSFFGLPLFLRKLHYWGGIFLALTFAGIFISFRSEDPGWSLGIGLFDSAYFLLYIFMTLKSNEITGRNYLENGWSFADPNGAEAECASVKWKLDQRTPWWHEPWWRRKSN